MKIKVELDNGVRLAWPTPIFSRAYPDTDAMNARLVEIIHEKEKADTGVPKSVSGKGWHSTEDVHTWDYPEIKRLFGFISDAVTELTKVSAGVSEDKFTGNTTFIAWANILRKGGYHRLHTHPACAWSGVYYIKSGGELPEGAPQDSGFIEFFDPRTAVEMVPVPGSPFGQRISLPPVEGTLYAFPAWLRHMVNPYDGDDERITIAFNVRIEDFQLFE